MFSAVFFRTCRMLTLPLLCQPHNLSGSKKQVEVFQFASLTFSPSALDLVGPVLVGETVVQVSTMRIERET